MPIYTLPPLGSITLNNSFRVMIYDGVTGQQVGCWLGTGREANGGVKFFFLRPARTRPAPALYTPSGGIPGLGSRYSLICRREHPVSVLSVHTCGNRILSVIGIGSIFNFTPQTKSKQLDSCQSCINRMTRWKDMSGSLWYGHELRHMAIRH